MKIVELNVYSFNELSEWAKRVALDSINIDCSFYYEEAYESVKAFHECFGTKTRGSSWLSFSTDSISDDVLELMGHRLQKYILNNYGYKLFKPKYIKHGELRDKRSPYHPMRKQVQLTGGPNNGKWMVSYYSRLKVDDDCVFTGVCYDNVLLGPIYEFLEQREDTNTNLQDLFDDCFDSLRLALDNEDEYNESDKAKIEYIEANGYEFFEDGKIYS